MVIDKKSFCYTLFLLVTALFVGEIYPKRIFLDGIQVVFRDSKGDVDLIMHSEMQRMELDGTAPDLEKKVTDLALAHEAKEWRLWPTAEEIDKQVHMLAEANKKTPAEFDDLLVTIGYTPQEGRTAFAQMNAVNSLINFKITANLIVPESQVVAYYTDHPEYVPASYRIQYAFIPFAQTKTRQEQEEALATLAAQGDPKDSLPWDEAFWITEDQLAQDKRSVIELVPGQITQPVETTTGFELFRLVDKKEQRLRSLDERYGEIANTLRKPKYGELMESFKKEVLDRSSLIYFDLSLYT